jgi:hypothetical protein
MSAYNPQDDLMLEDLAYRKKMAVATLNDAINQIYNIEGDRWQMAYDTLEAILANLNIEVDNSDLI